MHKIVKNNKSFIYLRFINILLITLIGYFTFHSIYGSRGLISLMKLTQQITKANEELYDIQAQKLDIEKHVNILRSESLDQDILEEIAKVNFGMIKDTEIIKKIPIQIQPNKNNSEDSSQ